MNNNSDLPEGWAMPPEMAKRLNEGLNKKSESPEDKVQGALDEIARDIAIIEPNPQDWGGWVEFLLEQMEAEAQRRRKGSDYVIMLQSLIDDLQNTIRNKRL